MFAIRKKLGLAITEQGLTAVEIALAGERKSVLHAVSLEFTTELNLDSPDRLGKELRQLLRRQGVQASHCVAGLAGNWTAGRERLLPKTDDESLRGAMTILAEREFASASAELVFDYSRCPVDGETWMLLAAAPQRVIRQVAAMAASAGLALSAITSTPLALAQATAGDIGPAGRLVLCLLNRSAELTWQCPGGARLFRHIPVRWDEQAAAGKSLAADLRRIMLTMPAAAKVQMLIWNAGAALNGQAVTEIEQALGVRAQACELRSGLERLDASPDMQAGFAPAAALAAVAPPLDFLHSQLAPPKPRRLSRPVLLGAAAAVAVLGAVLYLWWGWRTDQQQAAQLQLRLDKLQQPAKQAQTVVDDVAFAASWHDARPRYLDCLLEITRAFPQDSRIYATSLALKEDMQVLLIGKSSSEEAVQQVLDQLTANRRLCNVKTVYKRKAAANSPEISFALNVGLAGEK